ncbi:MAG TPA: CHAT domain-containing tetratricopeptide repeat protein [Rudaea sp.]|nr:CHAT domain-containing tetratricopeptide repeat protein [Rudaea sp.]
MSAAEASATRELDALRITSHTSSKRERAALDVLVDSAIIAHRLIDDATFAKNRRASAIVESIRPGDARAQIRYETVEAWRELQLSYLPGSSESHLLRAKEISDRIVAMLQQKRSGISATDAAFAYIAASRIALSGGREADAFAFATSAEGSVHRPTSLWEKRWRVASLIELGGAQRSTASLQKGIVTLAAASDAAARVAGKQSLLYADAQARLGQARQFAGDYDAAITSLQTAIAIYRQHTDIASSVAQVPTFVLANVLMSTGQYERARPLFEDVLARSRDDAGHFGQNYPAYLNSFAMLEQHLGEDDHARTLLKQAIELTVQLRGESSPILLPVLCNLGDLELTHARIDDAENAFRRASRIVGANGDKGYWKYFVNFGLGGVALARGQPAEAERDLDVAVAELQAIHGMHHPDMLELRCSRALALARNGETVQAFDEAESVETFRIDTVLRVVPALDEASALLFKRTEHKNCSGLVTALAQKLGDADHATRAWALVAEARGLVTSLRAQRLAAARHAPDDAGRKRWSDWEAAAQKYAHAVLHGDASETDARAIDEQLRSAEVALGQKALRAAGLNNASAAMNVRLSHRSPDNVVLAFANQERFDVAPAAKTARAQGDQLYAYVVDGAGVRIVALGDSGIIARDVNAWYALMRDPNAAADTLRQAGLAVRTSIWDPVIHAGSGKHVFIVPDGALFRADFAALPDGDGFLIERGWLIHELDREDDLDATPSDLIPDRLLLVGNPDFGRFIASASSARSDLCDDGFTPLPGTAVELHDIAALWNGSDRAPARLLEANAATKEGLRQAAPDVGILHIATHALTMGSPCSAESKTRQVGLSADSAKDAPDIDGALALAGANDYLKRRDPRGILTGSEVLSMPLDRVGWAVLSACDTGLGDIVNGEGVFGLRRAFHLAGAHTVIMSLWKVDDEATARWMQALYGARLVDRLATPEAIAQADLSVLQERRRRGENTNPFFWASFVAVGDWR